MKLLFKRKRRRGGRLKQADMKEQGVQSSDGTESTRGRSGSESCRSCDPFTSSERHLSAWTQDFRVCSWPGLYSSSCGCFCLSFAAKTPASLLPAGLCTLFHFRFNKIDVACCSQDTWHCSAWLWQRFQQKGDRREDCQEAISFSSGPTVPPASCERQA